MKRSHNIDLAPAFVLPKPKSKRTEKLLISLTRSEKERLKELAKEREETSATLARSLIIAALDALGK